MANNSRDPLTLARRFLEPSNSTHRQYEALRAYFVEGLPSAQAAARFGYTPASFRVLVHQFRHQPRREFFLPPAPREGPPASKNGCASRSSRSGSRTSPSTISLAPSPATASRSARRRSPRSSRKRASPNCRDAVTRSDPTNSAPSWAMWRMSAHLIWHRESSTPSLLDCSCSCRTWSRPTWTGCWRAAASPDRTWSLPPVPCGPCWP